jgi:CBS domain-containing protein
MTRDLFTLKPDDVVDLAASMMEWKHIRHIPVESEAGELVGLITARELIGIGISHAAPDNDPPAVATVMRTSYLEVTPDTAIDRAVDLVLASDTGCLLVVADGTLLGIVTERDLLAAKAQS